MGNMNPKQLKSAMRQFGIKTEEIDAKRVVFELDGKNLVIDNPEVTAMIIQGKKTYTVMGDAKEEAGSVPEEDVKMVAEQAGVSEKEAKEALEAAGGDIAEAITKLKG
ncbi:MAG: nascent polypeptide-associated complex protein [Candidatus Diapherotrites archaeon]